MIGSLGDVALVVSDRTIRTIDDYSRSGSARIGQHERMGAKAISEFLGPSLESVAFKIQLVRHWGVVPERELETLRRYRDTGEVLLLMLNNKVVGEDKWMIESLSESVDHFGMQGEILMVTVSVALIEYVERM